MSHKQTLATPHITSESENGWADLRQKYGCGPVEFAGSHNGLYERHLFFDKVVDLDEASARDRYEAFARSVRDVLSQRWVHTDNTYERENPKRVYYLSMEFLIGRSLANNISNMLLDLVAKKVIHDKELNWLRPFDTGSSAGLG